MQQERSLGDLFAELTRDTSTLVRKEIELAKTELGQKVSTAGKNVGFLAIGGAVAYAGVLALIGGVILLLAQALDSLWLSALLVGLVVAGAGYMLVQKGLTALRNVDLVPHKTIETLKEDKEWAKDQIS
jgi:hypothetical protein